MEVEYIQIETPQLKTRLYYNNKGFLALMQEILQVVHQLHPTKQPARLFSRKLIAKTQVSVY